MNNLHTYIPQDRLIALLNEQTLPDRTHGTALFADISGFTPLTEKLTNELGPRRGVEELSSRLNQVYDALISALERYGGSVIGFAGDAITCWFDNRPQETVVNGLPSAVNALSSALAMQTAMQAFPELALKISVASGPARRFIVGDPNIQLLDTLAGVTLARMAAGEHLAQKGEILADEKSLGEGVMVKEWRMDPDSREKFAVIPLLVLRSEPPSGTSQLSVINDQSLMRSSEILITEPLITEHWLLPAVYEREVAGMGAFLTELRSAVALFLRFDGIDYDADDDAGQKLDIFIRRAQEIVTRNGGTLLDVTIGDKGSYSYSAFGAPVAHENDSRRALNAAIELREMAAGLPFITGVQIGLSRGTMRTGAYGGTTRRTYGVLGDEVNLAARLMQAASPGQIIISGRVQYAAAGSFIFEALPAIRVKGKAQPVTIFQLHGLARDKTYRLLDPAYALPMVGRQTELSLITEKMELAMQGKGQIIGITAEAGMGKSRLVGEAIHLAQRHGFTGYGGACQSDGLNTAYLVWRAILRGFFDVDIDAPVEKQSKWLESALQSFAPNRLPALPLLAGAMGLSLPDNDFTRGLDPKDRKATLEAALVDCIRGAAEAASLGKSALLFVFEDLHWMDALSHDLLEEVARASESLPILILLAYRPPEIERIAAPHLEKLPHFTRIELTSLTLEETAAAIDAKLAQLFPDQPGSLPSTLTQKLMDRSQGNPFYLEELLNYLRDRSIDPRDEAALGKIDLPDSLHTLVLSRLDQLGEYEKTTLKVASIIGRLFRARWLNGYYPELGDDEPLKKTLEQLRWLEITPLDTPEPELAYLFKHLVTQEVTYESLPFATRALLHEQLAHWLETTLPDSPPLDLLAYHYGRSNNMEKKQEYWQKAGDAAKNSYANGAALEYYTCVWDILDEPSARVTVALARGSVLELVGRWQEAKSDYQHALESSEMVGRQAECWLALALLDQKMGRYNESLDWLAQARDEWMARGDLRGQALAVVETGNIQRLRGDLSQARLSLEDGVALARQAGDRPCIARALQILGVLSTIRSEYARACELYQQSLALQRELGDKRGEGMTLNNLGGNASSQGDYDTAWAFYIPSLEIRNAIGDKHGIAVTCNNLGIIARARNDYPAAIAYYRQSLAMAEELNDRRSMAIACNNLGNAAHWQGYLSEAREWHEKSLDIKRAIGDKRGISASLGNLGMVLADMGDFSGAENLYAEDLRLAHEMDDKETIIYALLYLASVAAMLGQPRRAAYLSATADAHLSTLSESWEAVEKEMLEKTREMSRQALGQAEFELICLESLQVSLEEVVAHALEKKI